MNRAVVPECVRLPEAARLMRGHGLPTHDVPAGSPEELLERVRGYRTVLHVFVDRPLPAAVLAEAGVEELISVGPGAQAVDDPAALERWGIAHSDTPGLAVQSVAEYTVGLVVLLLKRFHEGMRAVAGGGWPSLIGRELRETTLGVVGYGEIGRATASLARGLGMTVLVAASPARAARIRTDGCVAVGLAELMAASDAVSIHKRLTPETRHMIGAGLIGMMKPGSYLVNTARAELLDCEELLSALQSGAVAGAALDVFEREPLPPESLWRSHPRIVALPHLAWMTGAVIERMVSAAVAGSAGDRSALRRLR